ncbi:MAG: hypothetical protein WDN31_20520 [Hyphomicrobium sp.]
MGGRYVKRSRVAAEDLTTLEIRNGTALSWYGAVYDSQRRLVEELSCHDYSMPLAKHQLINSIKLLPRKERVRGTAAMLTSLHADRYYHWLIDIVPKIDQFLREGLDVDYYYVCNETAFQREINKRLLIPEAKIRQPKWGLHAQFDCLYARRADANSSGRIPSPRRFSENSVLRRAAAPAPYAATVCSER